MILAGKVENPRDYYYKNCPSISSKNTKQPSWGQTHRTCRMLKKAARPLGRGSFGVVSLAISQPKDEPRLSFPSFMAVKSAENSQLHSLQKEWKLLSKLADCPHILRCYGTFISYENGGVLFNIMLEYASGGSLANQIRSSGGRGGLSDYEVRWYAKSILLGLSHIHKQGYVHCDIKPHNILLLGGYRSLTSLRPRRKRVEEETVKIADFGSAKKAGKKGKRKGKGGWRGTPLYVAPESVLFQEYEPHSDIRAFGCTVLEMITGEPAWKCEPEAETCAVLYRIGFTRRVPEIPSWVTEEGKDFLRKCLVRDPKSRWTADMLLRHPFVSTKVVVLPSMESKTRESWLFQPKQEE